MDDLGNQLALGMRVVNLPGPVACSILPHTPYAAVLAEAAYRAGKTVMLHLPMESRERLPLGPGALTHVMSHGEITSVLQSDVVSVPHVQGINNHMGSLLTQNQAAMSWVMSEIKQHPSLFFLDSRTTPQTVALQTARGEGLSATRRDLFLDNTPKLSEVRKQFARLIALARAQKTALGIAHPNLATLQVLEEVLPMLPTLGVRLAPVSETVARRSAEPTTLEARNPYGSLPEVDTLPKLDRNSNRRNRLSLTKR
ncbi:conserved hypothetical protein [Gammaproteobacteria bacterium]